MTKMFKMTKRNDDALKFIYCYQLRHGTPPMAKQMADELGISKSAAWMRIKRLMDMGILSRADRKHTTKFTFNFKLII